MSIFIPFRMYGSLLFIFSKTNGCYLYFSNKVFQLWTYRYISPCGGALSGISSKVPSFELTFPFQSHYTKIRGEGNNMFYITACKLWCRVWTNTWVLFMLLELIFCFKCVCKSIIEIVRTSFPSSIQSKQ